MSINRRRSFPSKFTKVGHFVVPPTNETPNSSETDSQREQQPTHQRNRMMITQKRTVIAILTMIKMMQITIVHRLTWKVRMMHIRHNFSSQLWCLPVAMSTSSNLFQALKKSPVGVMAAGIFSTLAIVGTYRFAIRPILERRRREEAEAFAEYIFQQEKSKKTSSTLLASKSLSSLNLLDISL
ncbi:uncharacterized protein LOC111591701 [Ceratitis capitata]|nr:uncharacterized protein LOC111591701 [Ceratitis capitata]